MSPTAPETPDTFPRRALRSAGRRSMVFLGRFVIWAVLLVILASFVITQVRMYTTDHDAQADHDNKPQAGDAFPADAAASFAASFAEVYLRPQPDTPDEDEADEDEEGAVSGAALSDFVPEDEVRAYTLPETVSGERVRIVQVRADDDHHGLVTLSAQINGDPMHLEVPVYADNAAALVVSGPPALLPAPAQAKLPEQAAPEVDAEAAEEMEPVAEGFFAAWAETPEHLRRYTSPDADITPLPEDAFTFGEVTELTAPTGQADERAVQATVTWHLPEGGEVDTLTQRYELTMALVGGEWYVAHVQGAASAPTA